MSAASGTENIRMASVAAKVLSTVNAPFGANLDAHQLATCIANPDGAEKFIGPAFSFFSEVAPKLQKSFVAEMGLDPMAVKAVADMFSAKAGYKLTLAS